MEGERQGDINYEQAAKVEIPKESHLTAEGAKPIMVGLDSEYKMIGLATHKNYKESAERIRNSKTVHNVDYYKKYKGRTLINRVTGKETFLTGGQGSYVISPVDNVNKYSEDVKDCTLLVVAGIDRKTGENISFLSHQDPVKFLYNKKPQFTKNLKTKLEKLKKMSVPGSIDAVIVGGNYLEKFEQKDYKQNYLDSISLVSAEVKTILGFEPVVVNGPKLIPQRDDAYYDNQERRLHFIRPKINPKARDFTQNDFEKDPDEFKKQWSG